MTSPDKPRRRKSASRWIATGVLLLDAVATLTTLGICVMAVRRGFTGSMPYLSALIGALQAATAVVLAKYYDKSKAENTKGGIVYDTSVQAEPPPADEGGEL